MTSKTTRRFQRAFSRLPTHIRQQAKIAYRLFEKKPYHLSLEFKKIHVSGSVYSVRVGLHYRAVGVRTDDVMLWVWIGSHSEYDKLVKRMRG